MLKDYPTKEISNKDIAEPRKQKLQFSFPQHGETIEAYTYEEALEELTKKLNKK